MKNLQTITLLVFTSAIFFIFSTLANASSNQIDTHNTDMTGTAGTAESFVNNGDGTTTLSFYPLSGDLNSANTDADHLALTLQVDSKTQSYKIVGIEDNNITVLVELDANAITNIADSTVKLAPSMIEYVDQVAAK